MKRKQRGERKKSVEGNYVRETWVGELGVPDRVGYYVAFGFGKHSTFHIV